MASQSSAGEPELVARAASLDPMISIVLPTYNRCRLLPHSVGSILDQSESNWELILVDDGSSDRTQEVAAEFAARDPRISVVRQANRGLPEALNTGFSFARGSLFTWTSDDNRYRPEALALMSRCLLEHPEVGLVYAAMAINGPHGLEYWQGPRPCDYWEANKFGAAFLYRRTVAEKVGEYDAGLTMVEDYDFLLRASYHGEVRFLEEIVYDYGTHEGSLSATRRVEQARALERLLWKHRALGRVSRYQFSKLAATVAGNYRRSGQLRDALRMTAQAWWLSPVNYRSYRTALATCLSIAQRCVGR